MSQANAVNPGLADLIMQPLARWPVMICRACFDNVMYERGDSTQFQLQQQADAYCRLGDEFESRAHRRAARAESPRI